MRIASRMDKILLIGGVALYLVSLTILVGTGHTQVRFSGDGEQTRAIWLLWLSPLAGLCLAWLVPPRAPAADAFLGSDSRVVTRNAWVLVGLAVAFTVTLLLAPRTDWWFVGPKVLLLVVIPVALRIVTWREWAGLDVRGRWLRPLPAVAAAVLVTYALWPDREDTVPDALTIAVVFLLNAVIEEVFYRFWLQTRLESRYGRWPAILLTSVLWASWHMAILGGGGLAVDFAAVVVNIGVTGLFLGYLWSRHRNPWMVLLMHGLINAPLSMFIARG
ncbi:lysostaphin resistance A-like protein [Nocardia sp. NPDC050406]|uniref:lysostaphin resistance A-like protein n=1 Tax=Nocardia sp. NPDC050406 TaxID=3364318 RepID=UPI0037A247DA